VLVGCQSMGDDGGGALDKSVTVTLDNKTRLVVGFEGCADARDLLGAADRFLDFYLEGTPLSETLDRVNAGLSEDGAAAKMVALPDTDLSQTFLADVSAYWDRYSLDGDPEPAFFDTNIHIVNQCKGTDGKTYMEDEAFISAWSKETVFQGPFFSAERVNPQNKVDFRLEGALMNIVEGGHFSFMVSGSLSPEVQDLTLYADAVIEKVITDKEKPDEFIIEFKGQGKASPYRNEKGDICEMQDPYLVSTTGEPGTFKIPVTLKKGEQ